MSHVESCNGWKAVGAGKSRSSATGSVEPDATASTAATAATAATIVVAPRRLARRAGLAALAALTILAACGVAPPLDLRPPRVEIADVSIRDIGFTELRFMVAVRADNPNAVDIPLSDLTFDLELLGRPFATGIAAEPRLTLPARAARDVPVEFVVPTKRLVDLLGAATTGGWANLSYRLRGRAGWGWSGFPIAFEKYGDLDVLRRLRELLGPLGR